LFVEGLIKAESSINTELSAFLFALGRMLKDVERWQKLGYNTGYGKRWRMDIP
jgi:hypothetical protein